MPGPIILDPPSPDDRGMYGAGVQLPGPGPHAGVIITPVSCCRHGGRRQLSPASCSNLSSSCSGPGLFLGSGIYAAARHFLVMQTHEVVPEMALYKFEKLHFFCLVCYITNYMTHSNKTCKCQFKHIYKPFKCNAFIPTGDSEMHFIDVLAVKPLTVANQVILGKFISWCQSSLHCVMLTPWPHHLHNTAATYVNRNWSLPSHQSLFISTLLCCQ